MNARSGRKLSRKSGHRIATLNSLASHIILREEIVTTFPKAKEAARLADHIIAQSRRGARESFKNIARHIKDVEVRKKLYEVIAPRYQDRVGGYVRVIRMGHRRGDGAEMAVAKLV